MDDSKPTIELFIKAAPVGKEEKGPCPISQQWFMTFYVLVEKEFINLRVTPINLEQPPLPENYTKLNTGRKLPVAWVEKGIKPNSNQDLTGFVAETNDEIEKLVDLFKCENLALSRNSGEEERVEKVFENLYVHFKSALKTKNSSQLEMDMVKLNCYLAEHQFRHLLGEDLSYADCMLMPKLQHVIVAGSKLINFVIPFTLVHVWRYIENMYTTPAFIYSCPCDRDILCFYIDKLAMNRSSFEVKPTLMGDHITNTIPEDAVIAIRGSTTDNGE